MKTVSGQISRDSARIELFIGDTSVGPRKPIASKVSNPSEFKTVFDYLDHFFQHLISCNLGIELPLDQLVLSLSGEVEDNVFLSSKEVSWPTFSASDLVEKYKLKKVKLLTHIEALGYYDPYPTPENLFILNTKSDFSKEGQTLMIEMGKELDICVVLREGKKVQKVIANEGAYIPIPCKNRRDYEFQNFIRETLKMQENQYVDAAAVCCESGLLLVYRFVCKEFKRDPSGVSVNDLISKISDDCVFETIRYWFEMFIAWIFNVMTITLPSGGIFISSPLLLDIIKKSGDRQDDLTGYFIERLVMREYLMGVFENTPVTIFYDSSNLIIEGGLISLGY